VLADQLGSATLILLIWAVGALCALVGALCYSELGINFPSSGGEYVYLTAAFGPPWGFMTGWVSFFAGFSAPIAAAALAFSDYLGTFFPSFKLENSHHVVGSGSWEVKFGAAQILAAGVIALFTIINCLGLRYASRLQTAFTLAKVLGILAFLTAGFTFGSGTWENFFHAAVRSSPAPVFSQFIVSLVFIYFAYSGWNAATYIAEELKQPARTLPISLAYGTALVAALFMGLNVLFIYAVPLESMKGVVAIGALAATHLFGSSVAGVLSSFMLLAPLVTINAMVTIGPRVYYAMAKNGAFFAAAAKIHPRWHTPVLAIICQGVCAVLMTLVPFLNLLFYIGFILNFSAAMSVASLFVFRRRQGWRKVRVVSFAYPLLPISFVLVAIWITIFAMTSHPVTSAIAVITITTGMLVYHFSVRRSARTD